MRWGVLILLGVFFVSFASAVSETEAAFNIRGCNFDLVGGGNVGVSRGSCSPNRYYFCGENLEGDLDGGWATTGDDDYWSLGCAMGDPDYDATEDNSGDFCCPVGTNMFCNESEVGDTFRCMRRLDSCEVQESLRECNALDMGCTWFNNECIPNLAGLICGDYGTSLECEADNWSLADNEFGVDVCEDLIECNDTTYSVFCSCEWYDSATEGEKCKSAKLVKQTYYNDINDQNVFLCVNTGKLGDCVDGMQNVTWFSNVTAINGSATFMADVPDDCIDVVGCDGGEGERFCGEPIIKLPGFSLFAFFMSLFVIGMYYIKKYEKI